MTKKLSLSIILTIGLLISACNFPLFSKPAEEPNALATAVAQTLQAMAGQPLPTQQPPVVQPTTPAGLANGNTPATHGSYSLFRRLRQPPRSHAIKRYFVSETIKDDTEFDAGEAFNKSWTFKNVGTCTWNTNYKLVFASGEAMGGPASVKFSKTVAPNDQITIEVPLVAPATSGTYTGTWKLQADDDTQFGQVTVRIKVKSQAFAVTRVTTNLSDVSPAACPYTFAVDISITTSAAGKVTYETETSTGAFSGYKVPKF